jgi:hypothetical protein
VGRNCNSLNGESWEISHYANETFSQPRLNVSWLFGKLMAYLCTILHEVYRTATRQPTRYHTTDTNTCQYDKDSFTHQTAEVNISTRSVPRTAPDNAIRVCSKDKQGSCVSCTNCSQPRKNPVCPNMTKQKWNGELFIKRSSKMIIHAHQWTDRWWMLATQEYDLGIASSLARSITIFMANT